MLDVTQYRIALYPDADPERFEAHMRDHVFADPQVARPTRITRGFSHRLLSAARRQYVWQLEVDLLTDAGYDGEPTAEALSQRIADYGLVIGVESFRRADLPSGSI